MLNISIINYSLPLALARMSSIHRNTGRQTGCSCTVLQAAPSLFHCISTGLALRQSISCWITKNLSWRVIMLLRVKLPCWEVLQNAGANECPANEICDKFCWQIIHEIDTSLFDICSDCLVYLSRQNDTYLSKQMKLDIKMHREEDFLNSRTCQMFETVMNKLQHQGPTPRHA